MKTVLDPFGFPIDLTRPIVFDKNGEPQTEYQITEEFPLLGPGFWNVPSIWDGIQYDPDKDYEIIQRKAKEFIDKGGKLPNFTDPNKAVKAAIARSNYIGQVRKNDLTKALQEYYKNLPVENILKNPLLGK
jgi:hypothetical protein